MLINLRNALMTGKRLPYDAELEYLESTGTQWIDTGVIATENTRVKATLMTLSTDNKNWFGGQVMVVGGSNGFVFNSFSSNAIEYLFGNGRWKVIQVSNIVGRVFTLDFSKDGVVIDGITVATPSYTIFAQQTAPIAIFIRINGSGYINGRLYAFQIYQNGVLVRDFIPVRKGTVGYLYDRVSGKLFGNAGTGDFILGPDVVPVEYIEGTGTQYIDTGLMMAGATDFEYEIVTTPIDLASNQRIFSSDGNTPNYSVIISLTNFSASPMSNTLAATNGKKATIAYKNGVSTITSDGQTSTAPYSFTTPTGTYGLMLFRRANNAAASYFYKGRLHSATFTVGQDRRDFTPVRVGTDATSWEGAMMDVLTRRIYRNAGTGAFGYGNDLKYPIPAA